MTVGPKPHVRPSTAGACLLAAGLWLLVLNTPALALDSNDLRYGVSRVDRDPGIAIHWVLCEGETAEVVDLEAYQGGSVPPNGIPVFWQIRTESRAGGAARVDTFVVGVTPPGYYETVPLRRTLPADLIGISGPPGNGRSLGGMTFQVDELPRGAIYRGGYQMVTPEAFAADGIAACEREGAALGQGAGLVLLGMAVALFASRRRPTALAVGIAVVAIGVVGIGRAITGLPTLALGIEPRQPPTAFTSGRTEVPDTASTLAVISPDTARAVGDGFYVARINAPGAYSFAIDCDGRSIQVGEGAELPNGGTGSRQLIGCATGQLVRGAIADRSDRTDLVEIVVDASGSGNWRVVVVGEPGVTGPFREP